MFLSTCALILLATNFAFVRTEDSSEVMGRSSEEELSIELDKGPIKFTPQNPNRTKDFIPKNAKYFKPGHPVTIVGKEIIEEDRFLEEEDIMDRIIQTDQLLEAKPVIPTNPWFKPRPFSTQVQTGIVYTFKHPTSGRTMVLDHKPNKNGWRYLTFRFEEDIKEESTKYFMVMPTNLFAKAFGKEANAMNKNEYFLVGLLQKQGWGGNDYVFPITSDYKTKEGPRYTLGSNVAVAFNPLRCRKGIDSDKATGCFGTWNPFLFQFNQEFTDEKWISVWERYGNKKAVMFYGPATTGDKLYPNAFMQTVEDERDVRRSTRTFSIQPSPSLAYNVKSINYDLNRDILDKSAKSITLYSERTLQNQASTNLTSVIKFKRSITETYTFSIDTGLTVGSSLKAGFSFAETFGAGATASVTIKSTNGNSWTETTESEISISHMIFIKSKTSVKVEGILRMVEKFSIPFNSTLQVTMRGLRFDMKRHKIVEANVPSGFLKEWINDLGGKPKWTYVRDVGANIIEVNVQGNVFIDAGIKSFLKLTPIKT